MKKDLEKILNFGKKAVVITSLAVSSLFSGCTFEIIPFESNTKKEIESQFFVGGGVKVVNYIQDFNSEVITFDNNEIPFYLEKSPVVLNNISNKLYAADFNVGNSFVPKHFPFRFDAGVEFTYFLKQEDKEINSKEKESSFGNVNFYAGSNPIYSFEPSMTLSAWIPFGVGNPSPAGPKDGKYGLVLDVGAGFPFTKFEFEKYYFEDRLGKTTSLVENKFVNFGKSLNLGIYLQEISYKGRNRNEQSTKFGIKYSKKYYSTINLEGKSNNVSIDGFVFDFRVNF